MLNNKTIVLSGANITSGGPLTIYNDALIHFSSIPGCNVIAIVWKSELFFKAENITFIELLDYKKFIILKFYYEYLYYKILSKRIKPDIWISLNDFTPNVKVKKLFTYFHNASIFFDIEPSDFKFSKRVIFQKIYYSLFLRFNIQKNRRFIVQQNWIGRKINKKFNLPLKQILIFKPDQIVKDTKGSLIEREGVVKNNSRIVLFYPTRSYGYKNIEFICEIARKLLADYSSLNLELRLTVYPNENAYTRFIKDKYSELSISWLGPISKSEVEINYGDCSFFIFPSRLETWGLPLTEFAKYKKPIFAIDLEYVHETLDGYPYLYLFKPSDISKLAELVKNIIDGKDILFHRSQQNAYNNDIEHIKGWSDLLVI